MFFFDHSPQSWKCMFFISRSAPKKTTPDHRISWTRAILTTNIRNGKQSLDKYPQWEQEPQHVYLLNQWYLNKKLRVYFRSKKRLKSYHRFIGFNRFCETEALEHQELLWFERFLKKIKKKHSIFIVFNKV